MDSQLSIFGSSASVRKELDDVCRNRHGGDENSEAANERISDFKVQTRERIRVFVSACGPDGATLKETAAVLQHPTLKRAYQSNEISGRFTEMVKEKTLYKSGRRRSGSAVYVARKNWVNGSAQ